ncbi:L-arginine-binding protein-like isoform X1 [Amphiura filiformis]|uniref:L-arginine-binding protein-like isoform X1 n=1 Tax=Amphiura filiformis TaxID=82378 RepID=UPI003B2213B5
MEMGDAGKILPYESRSRDGCGGKVVLGLAILALVLASVALVVALISLTHKSSTNISVQGQGSKSTDERIWSIAIGHWTNNNVYIDEPSGQLKGFYVDMINAVCRLANKDCRIVYDVWQRCWQNVEGGEGLLGGWYDACAGWVKNPTRARTFQFTDKWQNTPTYYFLIKNGADFNPRDVTGKTFGFVDGWINDESCLARQSGITGSTLPSSQVRSYQSYEDLIDAVISGEVDATIDPDFIHVDHPDTLKLVKDVPILCTPADHGAGLMLRMDNPLADWWNPAQQRLMQTSEYRQICQDIKDEHGHMPGRDPKQFVSDLNKAKLSF